MEVFSICGGDHDERDPDSCVNETWYCPGCDKEIWIGDLLYDHMTQTYHCTAHLGAGPLFRSKEARDVWLTATFPEFQ